MGKSVEAILLEYNDRRNASFGRNTDYWRLHSVYHGNYFDVRARDIMDGAGRVMLRDNRRGDGSGPLVANLLKGIVDDFVSLTGSVPDVKVPPPGLEESDQHFADFMEKFHYGVWWASQMRLQLKCMGWWHSVMGGCSALVWPNHRKKHAEIRFVGPDKVYGVPDLIDPFAYSSAVIAEVISARTVRDYFPQKRVQTLLDTLDTQYGAGWPTSLGRVEIVRWFDKDEVVTILGREETDIRDSHGRFAKKESRIEPLIELGRAEHNLGFCTVVPFQNIMVPGETRGMSDIEESVGMNQYINFLLNAHEEGVKQELFAPLILEDATKAPEDIDLSSPTAIIPLNAGGKAYRLPAGGNAQQVMGQEINRAEHLIEYVTGTSAIRTQGRQPSSSIATGRSLEKGQAPQMSRIEYRNELNAHRLERVNELVVLMTASMFPKDKIELFGTQGRGGARFKITTTGDELQNYTYNIVTYPPSMHMGLEGRATLVLQLMGASTPLVSRRTAMEFLGMTDHPDEEIANIDADQARAVEQQKKLQAAAQPPAPQGPGSVLQTATALESGSTQKADTGGAGASSSAAGAVPAALPSGGAATGGEGPPGPAAGPSSALDPNSPPEAPAAPTSGLEGSLAQQVESIISSIALKGKVYLSEPSPERVEVLALDRRDYQRLSHVLNPVFKKSGVVVKQTKRIPQDAREVQGRAAKETAAPPPDR